MLRRMVLSLCLISSVLSDTPIVHLKPACPETTLGEPSLALTVDVPANAVAKCENGDRKLTSTNDVLFTMRGSFDPEHDGNYCLFHREAGTNTYSLDVEVQWEENGEYTDNRVRTISCMYDQEGVVLPSGDDLEQWLLTPWELQQPRGGAQTITTVSLKVLDVLGREITMSQIHEGRKIQLVAEDASGTSTGFRAHSCRATNGMAKYYILQSGCGDGFILNKTMGFTTKGSLVKSPYFEAFKLRGSPSLQFHCRFIACEEDCNGNSCSKASRRRRRSLLDIISQSFVSVTSGPVFLNPQT